MSTSSSSSSSSSSGPTFLDNIGLYLASSLLGPGTVAEQLRRQIHSHDTSQQQHAYAPIQLYWRSPLLTGLNILTLPSSPAKGGGKRGNGSPSGSGGSGNGSAKPHSRVVYIDATITFHPPHPLSPNKNKNDDDTPRESSRPHVQVQFGSLLRCWDGVTVNPTTGHIDRSCLPDGGRYIRQSSGVTKRGLRQYGESINVDLDSMESRPMARLLGKALQGDGLRAAVIEEEETKADGMNMGDIGGSGRERRNKRPRVAVALDHTLNLSETGQFMISGGNSKPGNEREAPKDDGHIGELAMKMILSNLEVSINGIRAIEGQSDADPEAMNRLMATFEQWWKVVSGDFQSHGPNIKIPRDSPMGKKMDAMGPNMDVANAEDTRNNQKDDSRSNTNVKPSYPVQEENRDTTGAAVKGTANAPQPVAAAATTGAANVTKENAQNRTSVPGNTTAPPADPKNDKPEPYPAKKKRKAPGPILVRAGGGIGGGRKKKKKGKITIGKA